MEIKALAWHEEFKKMSIEPVTFGSLFAKFDVDNDNSRIHQVNAPGIKLRLYSNHKDKQGVEIYDGDIIRIYNDELDENDSWIDEVSFHKGAFFSGDEDLLGNVHFRAKVIGNIYENSIKDLREGSI